MRHPMLTIVLILNLAACSNAVFTGKNGKSSSSDNTSANPPTEGDATGTPPDSETGNPPTEDPDTENPNNPGSDPCDTFSLSVESLYQLHDDQCHTDHNDGDDNDGDDDDDRDDDNDDDRDDDNGGGNNPGQNS